MRRIPLTQGKYALVNNCDYKYLMQWSWHVGGYKSRYARRNTFNDGSFFMHRDIASRMGLNISGLIIDHRNGDELDNRRRNLRIVTGTQSQANRRVGRNNSSGFKGVRKHRECWQALIGVDHQTIILGCFSTPIEAAKAYNKAARKYFGKFAFLNPIVPS